MTTNKYFVTNSRGRFDVTNVVAGGIGQLDPAGGYFKNFPRSIRPSYGIYAVSNGGGLNYYYRDSNNIKIEVGTKCSIKTVSGFYSSGNQNVDVPVWATSVAFVLIGAGGGGGLGGRGTNAHNGCGGAGGGSGGVIVSNAITIPTSHFDDGIDFSVGAGGDGGLRVNTTDTSITNGSRGGDTTVNINNFTYRAGGGGVEREGIT